MWTWILLFKFYVGYMDKNSENTIPFYWVNLTINNSITYSFNLGVYKTVAYV